MDDLEYITKGALMMCDKGAAPDYFKPDFNTKTKIDECLVATEMDAKPVKNIPSFKICSLTQKPCVPVTSPKTWKGTWQVKVDGAETLIGKSTCPCSTGGKIEFMTSGQVPLPADAAEEVQKMQDQAQEELNDSGEGDSVGESGLVEGFIPVWGSGRDAVNDFQQGRWGWGLFNSAMVVVDVFTLGGGSVVKGAIKGGVKATAKAVGKSAVKGLAKGLGKGAFKKLTKVALKSSIDDVAKKLLKTCVFACFPAGTQVHTELGLKNIEEIQTGDKVWAYNEETEETALQKVLYTMEKESDHTVEIVTENETIETTALHPFYVNGKWKEASELEKGDRIITQNKEEIVIKSVEFKYTSQKVYNFEVAHWHTYFVGENLFLVHNAKGKCISQYIKGLVGNRPLRELTHNEIYNAFRKAGIDLSNHAIKRLKDIRTKNLGFITPNDIMKIFNKGTQETVKKTIQRNGKEIVEKSVDNVYKGMRVVSDPKTGRVITIKPN